MSSSFEKSVKGATKIKVSPQQNIINRLRYVAYGSWRGIVEGFGDAPPIKI